MPVQISLKRNSQLAMIGYQSMHWHVDRTSLPSYCFFWSAHVSNKRPLALSEFAPCAAFARHPRIPSRWFCLNSWTNSMDPSDVTDGLKPCFQTGKGHYILLRKLFHPLRQFQIIKLYAVIPLRTQHRPAKWRASKHSTKLYAFLWCIWWQTGAWILSESQVWAQR